MKLGDKIKLHIERQPMFEGKEPDITEGVFTVIEVSSSLPHCFSESCWSHGFTHFSYGQEEDGRPDIVLKGSVYMPVPDMLDKPIMEKLHYDKKVVSWEVLDADTEVITAASTDPETGVKPVENAPEGSRLTSKGETPDA